MQENVNTRKLTPTEIRLEIVKAMLQNPAFLELRGSEDFKTTAREAVRFVQEGK